MPRNRSDLRFAKNYQIIMKASCSRGKGADREVCGVEPLALRTMFSEGVELPLPADMRGGRRVLRIEEFEVEDRYLCLLLANLEKDAARPSNEDLQTGLRTQLEVSDRRPLRTAAHAIIDLNPIHNGRYNYLIEQSEGFSKYIAGLAVRKMLMSAKNRNPAPFDVESPWGENRTRYARHKSEILDASSLWFEQSLRDGELKSIELVKEAENNGILPRGDAEFVTHTISARVDSANNFNTFAQARDYGRTHGYTKARLAIKNDTVDHEAHFTVPVHQADLSTIGIARRVAIPHNLFASDYETIDRGVVNAMKMILG